jgi:hypothetical protein
MFEAICLAGMLFANLWVADNLQTEKTEKGLLGGAALGALVGELLDKPGAEIGGGAGIVAAQPWIPVPVNEQLAPRDERVPILPPIKPGERPLCEAPPNQAEILRALPKLDRGVPAIYQVFRDDIEFTVEKMVDRIDPPRFFPLIGPAQLHHCHWKCTVYFTETVESTFPLPFRTKKRRVEVVYVDKDRLHLCVMPTTTTQACPAGCASAAKTAKACVPAAVSQVQMSVLVLQADRGRMQEVLKRLTHGVNFGEGGFGVTTDHQAALETAQALRKEGLVQFLAQPNLVTLSGREAHFVSGGQVAVTTNGKDGLTVGYQDIGVKVALTPTARTNGSINLNVHPQIITPASGGSVNDLRRFSTQGALVSAELEAGKSLVIGGLVMGRRELLILVTPKVVASPTIRQTGHAEECEPAPARRNEMTIGDVVRMSKKGISQEIILRQMEATNAVFNLTVDDIIELHDQGVSDLLIRAMQERRANSNP